MPTRNRMGIVKASVECRVECIRSKHESEGSDSERQEQERVGEGAQSRH